VASLFSTTQITVSELVVDGSVVSVLEIASSGGSSTHEESDGGEELEDEQEHEMVFLAASVPRHVAGDASKVSPAWLLRPRSPKPRALEKPPRV
jgi:hypothetical protein